MALTPANTVADPNDSVAETSRAAADTGGDDRVAIAQKEAAQYIHQFIQKTRSGTLGVIGMVLLVFVAISHAREHRGDTFNDIWGVTRGRNWLLRIVLYWTTITWVRRHCWPAWGSPAAAFCQRARTLVTQMPFIGNAVIFQLLPLVVLYG